MTNAQDSATPVRDDGACPPAPGDGCVRRNIARTMAMVAMYTTTSNGQREQSSKSLCYKVESLSDPCLGKTS